MAASRRAYLAWIAVCLIWGTTYLAIRITLETLPPFLMASIRWIVAGALIIAILKIRGERLPSVRLWGSLAVLGVLLLGLGNGGVVWAEQTVPSGLTAVMAAMSPFWMVGVEALMPDREPLSSRRLIGLIVGFAGIALLVGPDLRAGGGSGLVGGVIAAQVACVGWALGSTYARRHARQENVLATAALQMLFGGVAMLGVAVARGEPATISVVSARSVSALTYLTLVGAVAGFSAYAYALKHLPLATLSLYAYVNPVIAVILGTLILHEPFTPRVAVAAGVVLSGVALVHGKQV